MSHPRLASTSRRRLTLAGVAVLALLSGCASLPPPAVLEPVTALQDTADTPLARVWRHAPADRAPEVNAAVHPLDTLDAFAARVLLARAAQRSLDVQYYIWRDDITGRLLWRELRLASERGVRVRLLLDDHNTAGLDELLAALDSLPNLEVRLFNPFANRRHRLFDFASDFARVNRRMHNKSMTADNQATIVGGRNVGDEYFGAGDAIEFRDLDVLLFGPLVRDVSASFDAYWNAASAFPAATLLPPLSGAAADAALARLDAAASDPAATRYLQAVARAPLVEQLIAGDVPLEWVAGRLVADSPAKITEPAASAPPTLLEQLGPAVGVPQHGFDVVSPYFVPGAKGTAQLVELAGSGVRVRVLTNSLAATDVAAVHAGYSKRREALLRGGVQLFELRPEARSVPSADRGGPGGSRGGSSDASLHAKTFGVDGRKLFVGSFNFDPRSAALNTELGVVLDSPTLARQLAAAFDAKIPFGAYEVRLDANGALEWIERTPEGERRYSNDPGTGVLKRFGVGVLAILPIEWLL